MIKTSQIFQAIVRVRLLAAIAALFATVCLAHADDDSKDKPKDESKLPPGVTSVTKEQLLTKIPNFFYFDYPYQPQPGKRLWLRVDDEHWLERYPDGKDSIHKIIGRTTVRDQSGTIVMKIEGDPKKTQTENSGSFHVFIPDKDSKDMAILFRMGWDQEWQDMSWSENKKTEIRKVE